MKFIYITVGAIVVFAICVFLTKLPNEKSYNPIEAAIDSVCRNNYWEFQRKSSQAYCEEIGTCDKYCQWKKEGENLVWFFPNDIITEEELETEGYEYKCEFHLKDETEKFEPMEKEFMHQCRLVKRLDVFKHITDTLNN